MKHEEKRNPLKEKKSILKIGMVSLIVTCVIGTTGTFAFAREARVQNDDSNTNAYQTSVKAVEEPIERNSAERDCMNRAECDKTPVVEEPVVEEPVVEEPVVEEPVVEEPVVEEPVVEEPVVEEPVVEEPVVEEPVVEEPVVEEPVVEEPVVEELAVEEPAVEEPAVEESAVEEPAVVEPAVEEPAVEEPAVEEPAVEEPAVEEPVVEEPVVEEISVAEVSNAIPEGAEKTTLNCTAYTATGNATAVGVMPQANHTIASWKGLPFGTKVYIPALGTTFTVEDRGGAVSDGIIDIYMNSYNECIQFGRQNLEAYIIR